jgi:CHAT domain-containing protein
MEPALPRTVFLTAVALVICTACLPFAARCQPPAADSKQFSQLIDAGIALRRAHKYQESIDTIDKAVALARANRSAKLELLAVKFLALSYRELPDLQRVLALRLQALDIIRANPKAFADDASQEEASALEQVGGAYYLLNDLPDAIKYARAAADMAPYRGPGNVGNGRLRQFLGELLFLSGNLIESEKVLRAAYDDFEARVRVTQNLGWRPIDDYRFELGVLRWLERVLVAQGKYEDALQITEQSRERTLSGILGVASSAATRQATSVQDIKSIARKFATTMVVYSIVYELDPDLLLEFSGFVDTRAAELYIWVINPGGAIDFRKVELRTEDRSLADLIAGARLSIGAQGRGARRDAQAQDSSAPVAGGNYPMLQALHRILIEPIADLLPASSDSPLMLLPQDRLYLVPFAALQDPLGNFLVMRHPLFVNYSVAALPFEAEMLRHASEAGRGVLVVGNPQMPSYPYGPGGAMLPLPALPAAEKEARDISTLFRANALVGPSATKRTVVARMPTARIIHFATHGIMDRDEGQSQYFDTVALAPGDGDNGYLAVREIDKMHLAAELAVLSACDTADGKPTGDAVLGFSSAFLAAGVPSVVVAQWSIPDAPTALLMHTFYDQLLHGADKASALQRAMLVVMKQYPDPATWAAFSLIGAPTVASDLTAVAGNSVAASAGNVGTAAILVPGNITHYSENTYDPASGTSATFDTTLSIPNILQFYRDSYTKLGLKEDTRLTQIDPKSASMVMSDAGPHKLVVQVVNFDALAQPMRSVSVRYERKR